MHLLCTYMFLHCTYIFKNRLPILYVVTSVINFCNYIYNYTDDPSIPPNLSLTLPVSHLNSSKSVLQYNMITISTLYLLYLFFDAST